MEVLLPRLADRPVPSPSEGVEPIVARARAGDIAAATELVRHLGPRAERFCRHLGAPPGAEDDVVQEALVALLRSLPRFEGRSSIETWLYSVCVRVVRQHRRAHLRLLHAVRSFAAEADGVGTCPAGQECFTLYDYCSSSFICGTVADACDFTGCPQAQCTFDPEWTPEFFDEEDAGSPLICDN